MPRSHALSRRDHSPGQEHRDEASAQEKAMAEHQLRELYEGLTQEYAIFTLDPHGVITSWNDGAVRMNQYSPEEAIGRHFSMLYPPEEQRAGEPMTNLAIAARTGRYRSEGIRRRKSGQPFLADVQITPIRHEGRVVGFSKVVSDLTVQGRLREKREGEIRSLQAEREARHNYVSALGHDLRNPLGAVQAALQLLGRAPGLTAPRARLVQLSLGALDRVQRMIDDLLDIDRIRAGGAVAVNPVPCDLREIVEQVRSELELTFGPRFVLESPEAARGRWDAALLRRVVENLLTNAAKYGDAREPIRIRLTAAPGRVELKVHNRGAPIPTEEQARLFDRFERARVAETSGMKGWGIGLTLVRAFVEAHGGRVSLRSTESEGTTFAVELPEIARAEAPGPKSP